MKINKNIILGCMIERIVIQGTNIDGVYEMSFNISTNFDSLIAGLKKSKLHKTADAKKALALIKKEFKALKLNFNDIGYEDDLHAIASLIKKSEFKNVYFNDELKLINVHSHTDGGLVFEDGIQQDIMFFEFNKKDFMFYGQWVFELSEGADIFLTTYFSNKSYKIALPDHLNILPRNTSFNQFAKAYLDREETIKYLKKLAKSEFFNFADVKEVLYDVVSDINHLQHALGYKAGKGLI